MSMIDKAKLQLTKCAKCVGCDKLNDDSFRGDDGCFQFKAAKPDIEALKRTYNDVLKRMNKAVAYMDGPAPDVDKDKQLPRFQEVVRELSGIISELERAGRYMSDTEILEGFK